LRQPHRLAQLLKRQFLGDQLRRPRLDLGPTVAIRSPAEDRICDRLPRLQLAGAKTAGSVGSVLKDNGWNTAWFGKMHNVPDWMSSQAGPFDL